MDGAICFASAHYGIEAEDIAILRLCERYVLRGRAAGRFIDIGAYRPVQHSNTFALYERGWRGINVEANTLFAAEFRQQRPEDVTLNIALAGAARSMVYHRFDEPLLNGFLPAPSVERHKAGGFKHLGSEVMDSMSVATFLDRYVDFSIDLLNIDVEQSEFEILQAWDWHDKRPGAICVEIHALTVVDAIKDPVARLLYRQGYHMLARIDQNAVFVDDACLQACLRDLAA